MDDLISRSKTISDLLLHLHKSSSLLADLNLQKALEAYEEKKVQVKVKLDEINAQIVQFREKEETKKRVEEDKGEGEAETEKEKSDDQQESQRNAVQQRLEVLRQVIKQKRQEQQIIVTLAGHAARANYTKASLRENCRSWKRKGVEKKKTMGKVTERNEKTKKQRKFAWYFQRGGFPWL
jgi:TPP-dependent trihydroxycyclohexane-1,2-dione (THcHDO) dehydratase